MMLQKYSELVKRKKSEAAGGCRDKKAQEMKQISNMLASRNQLTHSIVNMIEKNFKSICERLPDGVDEPDKKSGADTLST